MTILKIFDDKTHSMWLFIIIGIILIFSARYMIRKINPRKEGFTTHENFIFKENSELYDDFYVKYYDELMFNEDKNKFEIGNIIQASNLTTESRILDIGSGTGHHLFSFSELDIPGIGLDSSEAMVQYSKSIYPALEFQSGNVMTKTYPRGAFTHILCLYFTLYYIQDKKKLFSNTYKWLAPGGYLVIHLVNKYKFNPVIPKSNKFQNVDIQVLEDGRITKSMATLDKYKYLSHFMIKNKEDPEDNSCMFEETFTDNFGKTRKNNHKFFMESQKEILHIAKQAGFILSSKIDMSPIGYDNQFLYVLQKPE